VAHASAVEEMVNLVILRPLPLFLAERFFEDISYSSSGKEWRLLI